MKQNCISRIKLNRGYDLFGDKKVIEKKPRFWGPRRIIYVRYVNWLMIIPEITRRRKQYI